MHFITICPCRQGLFVFYYRCTPIVNSSHLFCNLWLLGATVAAAMPLPRDRLKRSSKSKRGQGDML